jgi:CheY-like chemotaxis protein
MVNNSVFNKTKITTKDKKKILLIDDETDFCFFVKNILEQTRGFEVITATQGEEGINFARDKKPDLILLDILMPKACGPEVAEVLIKDPKTKKIPLIFLTAVVSKEEIGIQTIKKIGGHNFIAKPVDSKRLIRCIEMVLNEEPKENL